MGGWKLEVFKMAVYMAFPVGVFFFFHQPEYFEKWLDKIKAERYPTEDPEEKRQFQEMAKLYREQREKEILRALEETRKVK